MIIRNKTCVVFDVECLRNVFTCTCKDTEKHTYKVFEISERRNDVQEMCKYFLNKQYCFVGYNNIHFDNPLINYCIDYFQYIERSYFEMTNSLYNLSQIIIDKNGDKDKWKKWKYANYFMSIDLLTMLYSQALRVSLKEMQVTMQYKNVQEFVVDWKELLPVSSIDKLIEYNINDVDSTSQLLERCKKDLDLRIAIEDEYGIQALSKDGVNLGMEILKEEYLKASGKTWNDIRNLSSPCNTIDLEKVIFPNIKFKSKKLQVALELMKEQHEVSPGRKGYEYTFLFGGMKTTIGVGGIHGDCGAAIIKPTEDEILIDSDVSSLYPSLMVSYNLFPPHLGQVFIDVYSRIRRERLEAKRAGNKVKNETYKLALNGLTGNLQNEYSWCYSTFTVMQIRINGQLLLLMLAERLVEIGCTLKQINTDGILYLAPKDKKEQVLQICKDWEEETKLELEHEYFSEFYQLAINDYFGVYTNGKIKEKGAFITEVKLGKGLNPKIIPEAVINYFVHNIPVEQTIKECNDIRKFLMSEKTGKQWTVEYNEIVMQRINRFYASTKGFYLWKYKIENGKKSYQNMLKSSGVKLLNRLYDDDILNSFYSQGKSFQDIYDVNYAYYITEAKKIIEELKPKQLELF